MTQEFCSYEQSLELKELGFDEPCLGYWNIDPYLPKPTFNLVKPFDHEWCVPAPLKQQVFRWFRDKKLSDSYIYRYQDRTDGSINFGYSIINDYGIEETRFIKENYTSYEEAEDACINKLIELVKSKL